MRIVAAGVCLWIVSLLSMSDWADGGQPTRLKQPGANTTAKVSNLSIRQTWHQEPDGFDRPVIVSVPKSTSKKLPVVIFFHGNGGLAERGIHQWRILNDTLLVMPQGYQKSWNISGERSQAPDVEFVRTLIAFIGKKYPQADLKNVTLIGASNGSGLIHRLMIEMDDKPFRLAILLSASLVIEQYHQGSFWMPSKSTNDYNTLKKPTAGPAVIYFHGSEDHVVPYRGGLRGGKHRHLSAQETTYLWAKAFGYSGKQILDEKGKLVTRGIYEYRYPNANVVHYKLEGAGHGPRPYDEQVRAMIKNAIRR